MKLLFFYFLLLLFWSTNNVVNSITFLRDPVTFLNLNETLKGKKNDYKWKEEFFEKMPIDHFNYNDDRTFNLRYLINVMYYKPGGPIFFYTGNEGSIEVFAKNTGFMWDIAPDYHAAIVFAEHRFYGKSLPFGNESFSDIKNLGYLSSSQALGDFAVLIKFLKKDRLPNAIKSPVIAFGGSYGGMLASALRLKYPHLCEGAIASSAPIYWFQGKLNKDNTYDNIVTRTFKLSGCNVDTISKSIDAVKNIVTKKDGLDWINKLFKLEKKSLLTKAEDGEWLIDNFRDTLGTIAMVDYPYESNFLSPLPASPVKEACKHFQGSDKYDDKTLVTSIYKVLNLFNNYTGNTPNLCVNPDTCSGPFSGLGDILGWTWQACTEMIMPMCDNGLPDDMFPKNCPFNLNNYLEKFCKKTFEKIGYKTSLANPDSYMTNYGDSYETVGNIVFTNGYLDPWSGGGWMLKPGTKGSVVSIIISSGAHHYDLRERNKLDTPEVKEARRLEVKHISHWIRKAKKRHAKELKHQLREKQDLKKQKQMTKLTIR
ncbi:Lysosomal Pro-X carboxypeptidase [Strongyloides ratti]|uniref:Lysosomal Pro-X carboxypeptidase n=1 Tax=Strongyloides ratti TaxID=34506 RepID=A0A090MWL9_STRRB|nr:Lysosomal Pro-X carboxypeptidase [Strongyloides ratti]CEF63914.1 Lysosomal Pro-X carboxypeptidase [Strongyloides ratti]